jgi:hypothetical protein
MKNKLILTAVVLTYIIIGCEDHKSPIDVGGLGTGHEEPDTSETGQEIPDTSATRYPVEIPFEEYLLDGTSCLWNCLQSRNCRNKLEIIKSYVELENYITCTVGNYHDVDFSKSNMLFATGVTATLIRSVEKKLLKVSENEYNIDVTLEITDATQPDYWVVVIITNKLNENSNVKLNVERI